MIRPFSVGRLCRGKEASRQPIVNPRVLPITPEKTKLIPGRTTAMNSLQQTSTKSVLSILPENSRLQALSSLQLLDTGREEEFDELVQLAAAICGTPMGAMSLLDERRQWFKSSVGLAVSETPREIAFCDYTIRQKELFVVEDASSDPRFAANPLVTGEPGVQFYAGMPLTTPDGSAVGTLCVIDREPRTLNEQQRQALRVLARQVMGRIELRNQQKATAAAIAERDRIAAGLAEYQIQLEEANDRLRNLVVTDDLTGLKNRRAFDERLTFEFSMARRKGRDLSVLLIDADNFKDVNDRFGHPAGDAVLQLLAQVLQSTVRETDCAARYGGEEFAVILPETDELSALEWSRRVQQALARAPWQDRNVTVSIGVASLTRWSVDPAHLVSRADEALYRAKANGKNCAIAATELQLELSP